MNQRLTRISKFLSLILRHQPEQIGVVLDQDGWIDIDELLQAADRNGQAISRAELLAVVAQNDKQRFVIRENRMRANQGHSISINLNMPPSVPPPCLYHGTADRCLDSIRAQGLLKMQRQYVHLAIDLDTAHRVGQRHGRPVILQVNAGAMHAQGYPFFLAENGVWLTDTVPWPFINVIAPRR